MITRAVLFDLDGTLVDSLEDLTDAVNHIRDAFSQPPLTAGEVRTKIGRGVRDLVQRSLPGLSDPDIKRAIGMFLEFNRMHIADKSSLYPGIPETLHELSARGIRMAIVSNKNEDLSSLIVQTLRIQALFERICGGDTFPEKKPSPLPLLNVAENMGLSPCECIMAGDSINDIQAARHAGIASIACTWGYGSAEELAGADAFAHTPRELLAAITAGLR